MSYDSRLRCDFVDLYFTLYGTRRPNCIHSAELAGLFKPKLEKNEITTTKADVKPPQPIKQGLLLFFPFSPKILTIKTHLAFISSFNRSDN